MEPEATQSHGEPPPDIELIEQLRRVEEWNASVYAAAKEAS